MCKMFHNIKVLNYITMKHKTLYFIYLLIALDENVSNIFAVTSPQQINFMICFLFFLSHIICCKSGNILCIQSYKLLKGLVKVSGGRPSDLSYLVTTVKVWGFPRTEDMEMFVSDCTEGEGHWGDTDSPDWGSRPGTQSWGRLIITVLVWVPN